MYSPIAAVAIQIMQYDIALASSLYDGMREVVANNPHRNDADQRGFASCIAHGPNRFTSKMAFARRAYIVDPTFKANGAFITSATSVN
jgi:hypothetical protein